MSNSNDSKEMAAVELLKIIDANSGSEYIDKKLEDPKKYYLKLYLDCYETIDQGELPEDVE